MCAVVFSGCGAGTSDQAHVSSPKYIQWGSNSVRSSTIADVRGDEIRVCLSGSVTSEEFNLSRERTTRSVLTWLRVLKVMDESVTANVTFSCDNYHLIFYLRRGSGTSYASPSTINIYMNRPFGTWTHELGHAFAGLGDTYTNGTAGSCQSGQPQSLMCWGGYGPRRDQDEFSTLWPDDIAGVQANYRRLFGGDLTPPDWADEIDLEAPLDSENPWPAASPEIRFYGSNLVVDDNLKSFDQGESIDL
jgi:hypothetical protein